MQQTYKLQWHQWRNRSNVVGVADHGIDRYWSTKFMWLNSHLPLNQMRTCYNGLTWNLFPSNQLPKNVAQECHLLQRESIKKWYTQTTKWNDINDNHLFVHTIDQHVIHVLQITSSIVVEALDSCCSFNIFKWINDNLLQWTSKKFFFLQISGQEKWLKNAIDYKESWLEDGEHKSSMCTKLQIAMASMTKSFIETT